MEELLNTLTGNLARNMDLSVDREQIGARVELFHMNIFHPVLSPPAEKSTVGAPSLS